MKTFTRGCITDFEIIDCVGHKITLKAGEQYLTSGEKNGIVTVFTSYWATVPVLLFGHAEAFTE